MNRSKTMVALVAEYLAYRRKLGFQLLIEGRHLRNFAKYADGSGHRGPITTDLVLQWARLPKDASPMYWARRVEVIRCFAKYRVIFDPKTEIPPAGILGPAHRRPQPYIYSDKEIAELMEAAGELDPTGGLRSRTYVTLFGLLACTGLRISEALRLTREDVDLKQGLLTVRKTKFHKSRLVPLHPSAIKALRGYAHFRDRYYPIAKSKAFFLSEQGTRLKYSAVHPVFDKLREGLGWKAKHPTRPPRMHDLRHTFVCQRILQWYKEGVDVEYFTSALSTYLGHVRVTDTYWYLTGFPELLAVTAARFERFATQQPKETYDEG